MKKNLKVFLMVATALLISNVVYNPGGQQAPKPSEDRPYAKRLTLEDEAQEVLTSLQGTKSLLEEELKKLDALCEALGGVLFEQEEQLRQTKEQPSEKVSSDRSRAKNSIAELELLKKELLAKLKEVKENIGKLQECLDDELSGYSRRTLRNFRDAQKEAEPLVKKAEDQFSNCKQLINKLRSGGARTRSGIMDDAALASRLYEEDLASLASLSDKQRSQESDRFGGATQSSSSSSGSSSSSSSSSGSVASGSLRRDINSAGELNVGSASAENLANANPRIARGCGYDNEALLRRQMEQQAHGKSVCQEPQKEQEAMLYPLEIMLQNREVVQHLARIIERERENARLQQQNLDIQQHQERERYHNQRTFTIAEQKNDRILTIVEQKNREALATERKGREAEREARERDQQKHEIALATERAARERAINQREDAQRQLLREIQEIKDRATAQQLGAQKELTEREKEIIKMEKEMDSLRKELDNLRQQHERELATKQERYDERLATERERSDERLAAKQERYDERLATEQEQLSREQQQLASVQQQLATMQQQRNELAATAAQERLDRQRDIFLAALKEADLKAEIIYQRQRFEAKTMLERQRLERDRKTYEDKMKEFLKEMKEARNLNRLGGLFNFAMGLVNTNVTVNVNVTASADDATMNTGGR